MENGIARVWAVIRPPYYQQRTDYPLIGLPTLDLVRVGGDQYQGTYSNHYNHFHIEGTTCVPKLTTVSIENPLRRRAIIVAGGSQSYASQCALPHLTE